MGILEKTLERKMMRWCEAQGCLVIKIEAKRGWPDRIILKPTGMVLFVEFKAKGRRPNPLQSHVLQLLRAHKARAYWVSTQKEFMNAYLTEF